MIALFISSRAAVENVLRIHRLHKAMTPRICIKPSSLSTT